MLGAAAKRHRGPPRGTPMSKVLVLLAAMAGSVLASAEARVVGTGGRHCEAPGSIGLCCRRRCRRCWPVVVGLVISPFVVFLPR